MFYSSLCAESAKEDFDAFQKAEGELMEINSDLHAAEAVISRLPCNFCFSFNLNIIFFNSL